MEQRPKAFLATALTPKAANLTAGMRGGSSPRPSACATDAGRNQASAKRTEGESAAASPQVSPETHGPTPVAAAGRKEREPSFRMTLVVIRRRPTLPGRFQPSTISVLRLNFCVRDGNRWIPQAIVTGNLLGTCLSLLRFRFLLPASGFPFRLPVRSPRSRSWLRTLKTAQVAPLRSA